MIQSPQLGRHCACLSCKTRHFNKVRYCYYYYYYYYYYYVYLCCLV